MTATSGSTVILGWVPPDGADTIAWPELATIDLSEARCRSLGAEPVRSGQTWSGAISVFRVLASTGVSSDLRLGVTRRSAATVGLLIFDPVTMAASASCSVTVASHESGWSNDGTFVLPSTLAPGRYRVALVIAWPAGETFIHCMGRLDVLQELPS